MKNDKSWSHKLRWVGVWEEQGKMHIKLSLLIKLKNKKNNRFQMWEKTSHLKIANPRFCGKKSLLPGWRAKYPPNKMALDKSILSIFPLALGLMGFVHALRNLGTL